MAKAFCGAHAQHVWFHAAANQFSRMLDRGGKSQPPNHVGKSVLEQDRRQFIHPQ